MTMARRNLGGLVETEGGGIAWWSYRPPAVAPGAVRVADGIAFQVDGGDPQRLVAWSAASPGQVAALVPFLGPGEWTGEVEAFVQSGDRSPRRLVMPTVPDGAARLGLVAAVRRWFVRPIDETLLSIDEALAWHAAGHDAEAARLLSRSTSVLVSYGDQVLDGLLPGPVCDLVGTATSLAADLLPSGHPDRAEVREMAVQMSARAALADLQVAWTNVLPDSAGAMRSGRAVSATAVDLSLVPPRVLAWRSAREPEILSVHLQEQDLLEVTVPLAQGVRTTDGDVRDLTVSVTDPRTGRQWSAAGVQPDASDRGLVARVPLFGRGPDSLVVTLHSPERDPGQRGTSRGQDLAMAERLVVESWSWQRTGAVLTAAELWEDAEEIQDAARRAAEDALVRLQHLRDHGVSLGTPDGSWGDVGMPGALAVTAGVVDAETVQAALEAVEEWLDQPARGPESGPLLAEWDSVLGGQED
ncbi:hypothetical protein E4P40_10525 [Blastococcus sp. CT_GayMR20]|uniref:hypothetical protein n=1 Tax=Blastococcus sp. CT_GayMR20 TaxID=2559609 RepID=UPI0010741706|nr:hypothetical protein [Blastococcus sp. CT_GayMR20]TFV88056.1 hypothetical protein E4P40_10525 [Blastococcus sp. CT_GayMR20]